MSNVGFSPFRQAKPVWADGREYEMNLTLGFRTVIGKPAQGQMKLTLAASSIYRFFINGRFAGCGPARGPHGFYRVDEWDLSDSLDEGRNIIAIEVAGYNINSYYLLDQPSFLQAELAADGGVLAATGSGMKGFDALVIRERMQKVQRYSFQRTFTEVYNLENGFDGWKTDKTVVEGIKLCETGHKEFIRRIVEYPAFNVIKPGMTAAEGTFTKSDKVEAYWRDKSLTGIGSNLKGYLEDELECTLSYELDEFKTQSLKEESVVYSVDETAVVKQNAFRIYDFGNNYTGFIGLQLECTEDTVLYATFDEILINGDIDYKRLTCVDGVKYAFKPGKYSVETFEPYTLKFLKLAVLDGCAGVRSVYIREYAGTEAKSAGFASSSDALNRIYKAGVQSFRQNVTDIYMDCPSRERAGWLCDSFFTSRVEYVLTGKSLVEESFFENYLLPERFEFLPEGMLPMCYPADHNDGVFIPNWALWFVIELEEFLERSGNRKLVDQLKDKIYKLFGYFGRFKNEYGLLEKLESWVFVEWSEANNLVQDVNYPSNMLYAAALTAAGRLYGDREMENEAAAIRKTICEKSFDGEFFIDNAVRQNGELKVTGKKTEICQYYAFFFDVAAPDTYPELWRKLIEDFGPERGKTGLHPEVFPANAFVGNYLRLEILSRYGLSGKVIAEAVDFFDYMALKTGTLWENIDTSASCNHGFASHIVFCLYRDVLGIKHINKKDKVIEVKLADIDLEWCEGSIPVEDSLLTVKWRKEAGKPVCSIDAPEGYVVNIL